MLLMLFFGLTSRQSPSRNILMYVVPASEGRGVRACPANWLVPFWTSLTPALPPLARYMQCTSLFTCFSYVLKRPCSTGCAATEPDPMKVTAPADPGAASPKRESAAMARVLLLMRCESFACRDKASLLTNYFAKP